MTVWRKIRDTRQKQAERFFSKSPELVQVGLAKHAIAWKPKAKRIMSPLRLRSGSLLCDAQGTG